MELASVPIEERTDLVVRCPHCRCCFSCYEPSGGRQQMAAGRSGLQLPPLLPPIAAAGGLASPRPAQSFAAVASDANRRDAERKRNVYSMIEGARGGKEAIRAEQSRKRLGVSSNNRLGISNNQLGVSSNNRLGMSNNQLSATTGNDRTVSTFGTVEKQSQKEDVSSARKPRDNRAEEPRDEADGVEVPCARVDLNKDPCGLQVSTRTTLAERATANQSPVLLSVCPTQLKLGDAKVLSDVMKKAVAKLQSKEWEECTAGLHEIVYVCNADPAAAKPFLKSINLGQLKTLNSLRSTVVRAGCQATNHLFRTLRCTLRPAFDDIACALLHRTADLNRFIRADANEALDSMVTYVGAYHCVRVLALCSGHRNHLVRSSVARLLVCVALIAQPENVVGCRANRETRKRVLRTVALFLTDANLETRMFARELCKVLFTHEDFEASLQADVSPKVYEQVEKIVLQLKYQLNGVEHV